MDTFVVILLVIGVSFCCFAVAQYRKEAKEAKKEEIPHKTTTPLHSTPKAVIYHVGNDGKLTRTRPPEGRTLDGRALQTEDDWVQWYVWKGFTEGLSGYLYDLEAKMVAMENADSSDTLNEWHDCYSRIRRIYIRHSMWNYVLGDRSPFIPTSEQLSREKAYIHVIEKKQKEAMEAQRIYAKYSVAILDYIKTQPKHIALRSMLIRTVSEQFSETPEGIRKVYRRMCRIGIIKESQNDTGRWVVKKAAVRKPRDHGDMERVSRYSSDLYRKVTTRTEYKALITVGAPQNLSSEKGCCQFKSMSTGEVYTTHLDQCTCPVFCKGGEPCKHMVTLASKLGYYHIGVRISKPQ